MPRTTEIIEKIALLNFDDYLAIIISLFFISRFLISLINLLYKPLDKAKSIKSNKLISILIPARNEEKNIGNILKDVSNQTYKNLEIIVYDDLSTDKTSEIIHEIQKVDNRIKLINGKELQKGWLGKNFASYNLAQNASGEYFVFIDADVFLEPELIEKTLYFVEKEKLSLLSIFPNQIMKTWGEKIIVPLMNFILLSLLPLPSLKIRRFLKILSAANGQFMFFDAEVYKKYQPHKLMKIKKAEDISIARFFKKKAEKIRCLANVSEIKCRMYNSFDEAAHGFSKNIINMLIGNYFFAISFLVLSAFGLIFLGLYNLKLFYIIFIINILSHIFIARTTNNSIFVQIGLAIPRLFALAYIIYLSILKKIKKKNQWKGRNIYQ